MFVISSAIIVYLLAGADIEQLAVGALKAPARYPEVLRAAAIVALFWFWWRYFVVWLRHRLEFRREVRSALHRTKLFQNFFKKKLKAGYADSLEYMESTVLGGPGGPRGYITNVHAEGSRRLQIVVHQITFDIEGMGNCMAHVRESEGLIVDIPWWLHFGLVPFVSIWQAFRGDDFGNVVLPHLVALTALILVSLNSLGVDPAGLFGILDGGQSSVMSGLWATLTSTSSGTDADQSWINRIFDDPIALTALLVSALAVGFTLWRAWREIRHQRSRDYLDASTRLLERAFQSFEQKRSDEWNGLSYPDRWLWLTVARMLKESESTAEGITVGSHHALYEHARSFWRGNMYDLVRPLGDIPLTYFAEDADAILATSGEQRSCISDQSLRVVMDFVEWPKDKPDPLGERKRFTPHEIDHIRSFRYQAVGDFLDAQVAMINGEDSRKDFWRKKFQEAKHQRLPVHLN